MLGSVRCVQQQFRQWIHLLTGLQERLAQTNTEGRTSRFARRQYGQVP
jgi:hypothetical protein